MISVHKLWLTVKASYQPNELTKFQNSNDNSAAECEFKSIYWHTTCNKFSVLRCKRTVKIKKALAEF